MSESAFLESSHALVEKLLDLDNELKARICEKGKSADEIYQTYFERLSLYEKSLILPLNENDKVLLQNKKEDIYLELKLFKFKQDMKKQLDDIQTHLSDLEKTL
jgi:Cdc6-like AAA superfamily ATPase